ncbi:DUF2201 family putative metallopeptidase [Alteromonas sp. RKMC-009]|uniref:DUF2201 family putative metallopeptidase n=1 Tax=Alteromonas sp. RKMC-009 TaxID=2267264 RepID=UPI000E696C9B|nr:VWA-like domain-containing protein [Alteromonas sp. RKMC-009]AYA64282.1 hypothetical protein DS731_09905 [Alteromonas sp. RKMC-009]
MQTEEANKLLDTAKIHLISRPDSVFITTILFSLRFQWDTSSTLFSTDGKYLWINPEAFIRLTPDQRITLLAKAAYHTALQHVSRMKGKRKKHWYVSCDYATNDILKGTGFVLLDDAIHEPVYADQTSEDIYTIVDMVDERDLPFVHQSIRECEDMDAEDMAMWVEERVQSAFMKAKLMNQGSSIPGCVTTFLNNLRTPKLPWNRILDNVLTELAADDYSYQKPNKRYLDQNFIMPGLYSERLGSLRIYVDISGSITQVEFDQFISEIFHIVKKLQPSVTEVISFDTRLTDKHTVNELRDVVELVFHGGGGTRIGPVLDDIKEEKPEVSIIFTDGCFDIRERPIPREGQIFWIIHDNLHFKADTGKVIHYELLER